MNNIRFTCTTLAKTGKKGILVPDANGYYDQPIGGLSIFNSAGHFYTAEPAALALFENSSSLMRRIQRGALHGEIDHPAWGPGLSEDQYAARMMTIDPKLIAVHFSEIYLDTKNYRNPDGTPIVAICGKFKPAGPYAEVLQKQVENPNENVFFSIRAFTHDRIQRGIRTRTLAEIVTWDWVHEPGIPIAQKYGSQSLEKVQPATRKDVDLVVNPAMISKACDSNVLHLGRESVTLSKEQLFESFGWKDQQDPGFLKW